MCKIQYWYFPSLPYMFGICTYIYLGFVINVGKCSIQASVVTDDHRSAGPWGGSFSTESADRRRWRCGWKKVERMWESGRFWSWLVVLDYFFCWILWICVAYVYIVWSYVFASVIPGLKHCGSLTSRCLVLFSSIVICGTTSVFRKLSVWNLQDSSTMWMNTATFYEDWFQVFTAKCYESMNISDIWTIGWLAKANGR